MCLNGLITATFGSSEPFCMLRLMGISLQIESTDSMIDNCQLERVIFYGKP